MANPHCLFSVTEHDLRSLLRNGSSEAEIEEWLRKIVWQKESAPSHRRAGFCAGVALDECMGIISKCKSGLSPIFLSSTVLKLTIV